MPGYSITLACVAAWLVVMVTTVYGSDDAKANHTNGNNGVGPPCNHQSGITINIGGNGLVSGNGGLSSPSLMIPGLTININIGMGSGGAQFPCQQTTINNSTKPMTLPPVTPTKFVRTVAPTTAKQPASCTSEYGLCKMEVSGKSYFLWVLDGVTDDANDAISKCQSAYGSDARLPEATTPTDLETIMTLAQAGTGDKPSNVWMGAKYVSYIGSFRYPSGNPVNAVVWAPGYPAQHTTYSCAAAICRDWRVLIGRIYEIQNTACSGSRSSNKNIVCSVPIPPGVIHDSQLTKWTSWGSCSSTCGGGSRTRERSCVASTYGGAPCSGHLDQTSECSTNRCPYRRRG